MRELEFQASDWPELTLGEVCEFRGGNGFPERSQGSTAGEFPFIKVSDLTLPSNEKYITASNNWVTREGLQQLRAVLHPAGAVVFAKVGAALKLNRRRILTRPTAIDNNMMSAVANADHLDAEYLYFFLLANDLGRFSQDGAVPSINQGHLSGIAIGLPPLHEQRKIAEILRAWDDFIEKLETLRAAKEKLAISIADDLIFGVRRINGFREPWRPSRLAEVTREITRRNRDGAIGRDLVMGVTNSRGIVPMREQTIAADISRYLVLPPRAFAYNPMRINVGSIAMSRLEHDVLVSPDYVLFECLPGKLDPDFLDHLRQSHLWSHYINTGGTGSVRMRTYYDDLAALKIKLPPFDEQLAISEALSTAKSELALISDKIDVLARQKRGLMQKLLTGEWRIAAETVSQNQQGPQNG